MSITPYVLPTRCTRCTGSNETIPSVEFFQDAAPPRSISQTGRQCPRDHPPSSKIGPGGRDEKWLALCPIPPNSGSKSIMTRVTPFYFSPLQTMFLISVAFFVRCTPSSVFRVTIENRWSGNRWIPSFVPVAQISGGWWVEG